MYTEDYDESFPSSNAFGGYYGVSCWNCSSSNPEYFNTLQYADPYMKSTDVWACPSNPYNSFAMNYNTLSVKDRASYATNAELFEPQYGAPHILAFINEPASKIIIYCSKSP
jgi:hypothetical protein